MYKTRLQELCQKKKWELPKYNTGKNGPAHAPLFTSAVTVQDQVFESPEEFRSVKEAQNTAARIAYDQLNVPSPVGSAPAIVGSQFQTVCAGLLLEKKDADTKPANGEELQENYADTQTSTCYEGLYKNLLQEFAHKKGLLCPSYETVGSGMSHRPAFVSVVAIGTDTFQGDEAKTKKQAEMNAAKVAYFALTKVTNSSTVSTISESPVADNLSQNVQPTATIRKHHDTTNEEPDAKRGKASPEISASLTNQPWKQWKTVVIPREHN